MRGEQSELRASRTELEKLEVQRRNSRSALSVASTAVPRVCPSRRRIVPSAAKNHIFFFSLPPPFVLFFQDCPVIAWRDIAIAIKDRVSKEDESRFSLEGGIGSGKKEAGQTTLVSFDTCYCDSLGQSKFDTYSAKMSIDIDKPRWDQSTYAGRARHFFTVTNPMNIFATNRELERAKDIVTKYKKGASLSQLGVSEDELWRSKYLYDSAFHPDTGEKMFIIGRMSAQVPMNMLITGCMMTFYKTTSATVFWQWFNQSFNAVVNYTNRSGSSPIPVETLAMSYVGATSGALVTALSLNKLARRGPPLAGRLVPLAAVAAANCVNIPLMRFTEIRDGIELQNEAGEFLGRSRKAAKEAIASVTVSRILMSTPSMLLSPIIIDTLERRRILSPGSWAAGPIQVIFCGLCLTFATPLCCALFAQRVAVKVDHLEKEAQEEIKKKASNAEVVYYNKGL